MTWFRFGWIAYTVFFMAITVRTSALGRKLHREGRLTVPTSLALLVPYVFGCLLAAALVGMVTSVASRG